MNFNSLDLNLIRVFDALMRERSVTRAGEQIALSQPAVSAALNRLRHVFNDNLFVRQGNDMMPTPRAVELAEHARAALAEIESMVRAVRGLNPAELNRTFTLLGADFFSMFLMPHLAHKIAQQAPQVRLRLLDSARGDPAKLLLENAIDIALERPLEMPDWIRSELLFQSPFVVIASKKNAALRKLADGSVIPIEIYSRLPHTLRSIDGSMSGMTDDALAKHGLSRSVTLALPHFQGVALAVAAGDHIAAVPLQHANAVKESLGLRVFRPPIDIPVPNVYLYWHSRYDRDVSHRWLRDNLIESVRELGFDKID